MNDNNRPNKELRVITNANLSFLSDPESNINKWAFYIEDNN